MTRPFVALDAAFHQLVPPDARLERVASGFAFTEGPVWRQDHLLFSDVPRSRIARWQDLPEGPEVRTFRVEHAAEGVLGASGNCNGMTLDTQDRLIVCGQGARRVTRTEPDGTIVVIADRFEGRRLNSPNDVVVHPSGAIYFTDPPHGLRSLSEGKELPFQGVYRIGVNGALSLLVDDFQHPNGLAFSPDYSVLYIGDDARGHVRAFDVTEDGTLTAGRIFAAMPLPATLSPDENPPDGMKVDSMGNLYVTVMGGVWIFDESSRLLGMINLPEATANLAWGGSDWRTLFITASTSLYRIRLSVAGVPVGRAALSA
ncbi:MAG TPA: SMP-30/gluconolactonase/LRE family protein [Chloroflexota bacterium]|nr:SMP-30/gluconolactonase/LRE family protein [Chloroflexota bacterium]